MVLLSGSVSQSYLFIVTCASAARRSALSPRASSACFLAVPSPTAQGGQRGIRSGHHRGGRTAYHASYMSATHTGTLTKTPLGLGLTIDPNNIIATVKEGSQAEREGHFAVGDLVLTVNGEPPAPGQGVTAIIQSLPMGAQLEFAMQRAAMGVIVATPGPTEDNGLCRGSIADVAERAIDEAYKIKYEKLKQRAKWLNAAAALLLCGVSGMSLAGTGGHCSPMLIKVVMCWMSVIGAVLLLAELHVEKVLAYVHVLSYRSGRALIALMAGTITLAAAPSEIPMYATPSTPITLAPAAARRLLCAAQVQCRSRPGRPLSDERQGGPLTLP